VSNPLLPRVLDPGLASRGRGARVVQLLLLLAGVGLAAAQPCGRPGFGLSYSTEPEISGGLFVTELVLTDAPTPTLDFLPTILVDGVAAEPVEPIRLLCDELILYRQPIAEPAQRLHWALLRWPLIPKLLSAAPPEVVMASYTHIPFLQERPSPLVEVVFPRNPVSGERWPLAAPPEQAHLAIPGDPGRDDGVTWVLPAPTADPPEGTAATTLSGLGTLARAPVASRIPFELRLHSRAGSGGPVVFACFLNGRQVNPFAGHPYVVATAVVDATLIAFGEIVVPGPGWHQLQCLALDDDPPGTHPTSFMRPLDEAYVWGD